MQPATLHPCACEVCGAPVVPDFLSGEALDAQPELTKHGETIYHWHHCNVAPPRPRDWRQAPRQYRSTAYNRADAALPTIAS